MKCSILRIFLLVAIISALLVLVYAYGFPSFVIEQTRLPDTQNPPGMTFEHTRLLGTQNPPDTTLEHTRLLGTQNPPDMTLEPTRLLSNETLSDMVLESHSKTKCFLLILVMTRTNGEKRKAVRETWFQEAKKLAPKILAKFVIGTYGLDSKTMESLRSEDQEYNDMVFLPELVDRYENLTRKTLESIVWIEENVEMSYVLKTDDDSYVLVKKMLKELENRKSLMGLYWGFMMSNVPVKSPIPKNDREHDWFLCKTFLPFASGGGYVLSANVIHAVASNAHMVQLYANEDTSVAVWISAFKLERKHDTRFNTINRKCVKGQILVHWINTQLIYNFHQQFLSIGDLC